MRWRFPRMVLLALCLAIVFFFFNWYSSSANYKYTEVTLGQSLSFPIHFIEQTPKVWNRTVVLLHGQTFDSRVWQRTKTMDFLATAGYRVVAIDLPGHGYSKGPTIIPRYSARAVILKEILTKLHAINAVLVSPSMSGTFAMPLIVRGDLPLAGFVAISVEGIDHFSLVEYSMLTIPTGIIYGEDDKGASELTRKTLRHIKGSREYKIAGVGDPCYLLNPNDFHKALISFLSQLEK